VRSIGSVGVLALQGAFRAHAQRLADLDVATREVRTADDLERVEALVMPGGESTTMSLLLASAGLVDPIAHRLADGMPVLGTCAGMILLATRIGDGRPDQHAFGAIDIDVRRNGYGRQVDSFETDLDVVGLDESFHAVFIRAPMVERVGPGVEVLATHEGHVVLARTGHVTVAAFHPELTPDARIHEQFLSHATSPSLRVVESEAS
jgi:5'-phosphate synthase pdxT subunit